MRKGPALAIARLVTALGAVLGINIAPLDGLLEQGENATASVAVLLLYLLSEGAIRFFGGRKPPPPQT